MIRDVQLSSQEVAIGEAVSLSVFADSPISLTIGCFIDRPPPPRFAGCAECSVQTVRSGEEVTIRPQLETWLHQEGGYLISIRDAEGDEREIRIRVFSASASAESAGFMTK